MEIYWEHSLILRRNFLVHFINKFNSNQPTDSTER